MSRQATISALNNVLAESYCLYLKTQNYHWNVEGPRFYALHKMFEAQYSDLAAAIDEIAERIRALGAKAPGTFNAFSTASSIQDGDAHANEEAMLSDLIKDNNTLVKTLTNAVKAAQSDNDEATADLMIERIQAHEKVAWMLKSSV